MIELDAISQIGLGTSRAASLGRRLNAMQFERLSLLMEGAGQNLIDTSDFYGSGDAERLVGKSIAKRREKFFIVTKAGLPVVHLPGFLSPANQVAKKIKQRLSGKPDFSRNNLMKRLELSLRRLGVDAVDAFLLHEPDNGDLTDDSWKALGQIRERGWARYTGISTNDVQAVRRGLESGEVQVVQTFAAWGRPSTDEIPALCRVAGIPLMLNRVLDPMLDLRESYSTREAKIGKIPGLEGMSCVQFLMAAALVEKRADTVLTGTLKEDHLEHNLRALDYVEPLARHWEEVRTLLS
jgi:pyridoxine 4-dehydrogenase